MINTWQPYRVEYDNPFPSWEEVAAGVYPNKTGRVIVAGESEWNKPKKMADQLAFMKQEAANWHVDPAQLKDHLEFLVDIPCIGMEWEGGLVATDGHPLRQGMNGNFGSSVDWSHLAAWTDVFSRIFRTIDECPHVDFVLPVVEPGQVKQVWPFDTDHGHDSLPHDMPRKLPNAILAQRIQRQSDLERTPEFLKLKDLSKELWLWIKPMEEIDFWISNGGGEIFNVLNCQVSQPSGNNFIASGISPPAKIILSGSDTKAPWKVGDRVGRKTALDDGIWRRHGDICLNDSKVLFGKVISRSDERADEVVVSFDTGAIARFLDHGLDSEQAIWIASLIEQCQQAGVEYEIIDSRG